MFIIFVIILKLYYLIIFHLYDSVIDDITMLYTRSSCLFYLIAQSYGFIKIIYFLKILLGNIPHSLCCAICITFSIDVTFVKQKKKIILLYFIATLKNSRISANAAYLDCEVTAFGLCYCSQVTV